MTPLFQACLDRVLKVEGGFVNRSEDHGGPTNYGITQATLADYRGNPVTASDVEHLTVVEASKIYEAKFWDLMQMDRVKSQRVALFLFDQGVNAGPETAIKMLQQTLNDSFGERLVVDGWLGNQTTVALATTPEPALCRALINHAVSRYADLCITRPANLVFLKGWVNRALSLLDALA